MAYQTSALNINKNFVLDDEGLSGWSSTNNIVKDPPKSVHTRQILKVGQNEAKKKTLEREDELINTNILQFARSVNPFVSTSYQNSSGAQASLPYKILNNGEFRPPVQTLEQIFPLSRQPAKVPELYTNISKLDGNKLTKPNYKPEEYREIIHETLNPKLDKINEKYTKIKIDHDKNVTNFIINPIVVTEKYSHKNPTLRKYQTGNINPHTVLNETFKYETNINKNGTVFRDSNHNKFQTDNSIKEKLTFNINSNKNMRLNNKNQRPKNLSKNIKNGIKSGSYMNNRITTKKTFENFNRNVELQPKIKLYDVKTNSNSRRNYKENYTNRKINSLSWKNNHNINHINNPNQFISKRPEKTYERNLKLRSNKPDPNLYNKNRTGTDKKSMMKY